MTIDDIINDVKEGCSEWLEMTDNPDQIVIRALAGRIVLLNDKINYLERRLQYVSLGDRDDR